MRRWTAMIGVLAVIGCSSVSQRSHRVQLPSISQRPTEYDMRKEYPELQKYFRTSLRRVYSAGRAAVRDLGWQIVAARILRTEAKIEARKGKEQTTTIFFKQVTPVRTRVAVLVTGASARRGRNVASDVHERIATILRIKAED